VVADLNPRVSTNTSRSQNTHASAADIRPKHHGSETRQTLQIAGRVSPALKSEIIRIAKLKGWTESKTTQMRQENNRAGNLALEAFHSAEEGGSSPYT
jgi:hypothetical protein